jgi:hypothetical protein
MAVKDAGESNELREWWETKGGVEDVIGDLLSPMVHVEGV